MARRFASYFGVDAPVVFTSLVALVVLIVLSLGSAPAKAQSANVYSYGQSVQSAQYGTVIGTRVVQVTAPNSGTTQVGSLVGATLGGALGAHLGQNAGWQGQTALATIGAALGGFGGNRVAERSATQDALEVLVQLKTTYGQPQVIAVVQPFPGPNLVIGQPVVVLGGGNQTRIVPMQVDPASLQQPQGQQQNPARYQAPAQYQSQPIQSAFNGG